MAEKKVSGLEIRAKDFESFADLVWDMAEKGEELYGVCNVEKGTLVSPVLPKRDYAVVDYQARTGERTTSGTGIWHYSSSTIFDIKQFD